MWLPDAGDYAMLSLADAIERIPEEAISQMQRMPGDSLIKHHLQQNLDLIWSFVESSTSIKRCSHPNCRFVNAVEFKDFEQLKRTNPTKLFEVICRNSHSF